MKKSINAIKPISLVLFFAAVLLILVRMLHIPADLRRFHPPRLRSVATDRSVFFSVTNHCLPEISGLARSRVTLGLFWMNNDSFDPNTIIGVDTTGAVRAIVSTGGYSNRDWEDVRTFRWHDTDFLMIAETGDNLSIWPSVEVALFPEPAIDLSKALTKLTLPLVGGFNFTFPGGPRDCEAAAVDTARGEVILVSKRKTPPVAYTVSLDHPLSLIPFQAQTLTPIPDIPPPNPTKGKRNPRIGLLGSQPTSADISPDGLRFALLTYRRAYIWTRKSTRDPWGPILFTAPQWVDFGELKQAEGICFSEDGKEIFVAGEGLPSPVIRVRL